MLVCGLGFVAAHTAHAESGDSWAIPAVVSCDAPASGAPANAVPKPFRVGDVLDERKSAVLEGFVPEELWAHRDRFFYDGMSLEIGPCYRDYSPPEFFARATAQFRGQGEAVRRRRAREPQRRSPVRARHDRPERSVGRRKVGVELGVALPGGRQLRRLPPEPARARFAAALHRRRAVVIEGRFKHGAFGDGVRRFVWYLDL